MSTADILSTPLPHEVSSDLFANSAHRFSVEDYHRMNNLGLLDENYKMELLEGYLVQKMNQRPIHSATVEMIDDALRPFLPNGWKLRVQLPITTETSEPEPDLAVVSGSAQSRLSSHPQSGQIAMVVEVAETSLQRDQEKSRIYAQAEIPVYWIINLVDLRIEVQIAPDKFLIPPRYTQHRNYNREEKIPLVIDGKEITMIDASALLPEITP